MIEDISNTSPNQKNKIKIACRNKSWLKYIFFFKKKKRKKKIREEVFVEKFFVKTNRKQNSSTTFYYLTMNYHFQKESIISQESIWRRKFKTNNIVKPHIET
jgi:hypothetical protein